MANMMLYLSLFCIWALLLYHLFLMQGGYLLSRKNRQMERRWQQNKTPFPTVSILIPAHNEALVIGDTLQAMCQLNYPLQSLEVIVINDHSSDGTGEIVEDYVKQYPFIKVIHTVPPLGGKGKSRALNLGLEQAVGDIICVYDADNIPESDAIYWLTAGLANDSKAGAVVGKFRVNNANKNFLTRLINIETISFQWLAQAGRWFWFKMTTIPGTNFAIRRSILEELGGWDEKALSEDTELSFRVYDLGYHIRFFPSAITWEQEPESWKVWWKQRTRWARGNLYVITKFILQFYRLKNKKVFIDLFYFFFTYLLFFFGVVTSHGLFITNLFIDLGLTIGYVSILLIGIGFLLFIIEEMLALSLEKGQLTVKNMLIVGLMYFTYSQLWLFLVVYATFLEMKRIVLRQEVKWDKTKRFVSEKK
ncbi:Poly-beta-1,6-N-acetyl-D-glucosamine synthase [Paraliobacillus sp. PM-2]|uniref:glycosyltransferase family 2 protein n=1 Tax=Paraliobacillus sp. PM-2 TaxID=1462524 RepID=UPI00061C15EA|nr:glycosyltransferase [Paraliobacillus sp. PM-2]CQR46342.1 Poly-beta-1,6-N-acetyl-D-glucosamine synthase [Paraliobacillus sp. PM-2]